MQGNTGSQGPEGPAGLQGNPGPQGPPGPSSSGSYTLDEWSFAGFTSTDYDGGFGGRWLAHAACAAEFTDAHMCHVSEYLLTNSATSIPAAGAWMDGSVDVEGTSIYGGVPSAGRRTNFSCSSWTSNVSGASGTMVRTDSLFDAYGDCAEQRPVACCNGPRKVVLAGYTTANATMNARPGMHAQCSSEFPGAHMCHVAEYLRANAISPIPASGAWMDGSIDLHGSSVYGGVPGAGRRTNFSCSSWNSTTPGASGTMIRADSLFDAYGDCAVPRPIACCI